MELRGNLNLKRTCIVVAVVLITGMLLLVLDQRPKLQGPIFESSASVVSNGIQYSITYEFLAPHPFEGGKTWIGYQSTKPPYQAIWYLFDIENGKVLGHMTRGYPLAMNRDQSKVLCTEEIPANEFSRLMNSTLKEQFGRLIERLSRGHIRIWPPDNYFDHPQRLWLVDMNRKTVDQVGILPVRLTSTMMPSPDSRYAVSTMMGRTGMHTVCFDLEKGSLFYLPVTDTSFHAGWWDNRNLFVQTTNRDFALYDVVNRQLKPFIAAAAVSYCLPEQAKDSSQMGVFSIWNGREYDFWITTHQKWLAKESYLIKVQRPSGNLKVIAPQFKFEWSDHFDPTMRYYLFTGRESGRGSNGVFVRDLASGTNRTLVEATSAMYFSIPRFYGDSVIYIRNNALWRIGLDGTNNRLLFPN